MRKAHKIDNPDLGVGILGLGVTVFAFALVCALHCSNWCLLQGSQGTTGGHLFNPLDVQVEDCMHRRDRPAVGSVHYDCWITRVSPACQCECVQLKDGYNRVPGCHVTVTLLLSSAAEPRGPPTCAQGAKNPGLRI